MSLDFIGHCIDTAIPFAIGVIGLVYFPRRVRKDIESKKHSDEDGKKRLKKYKIFCYLILLLGFLKLTEFFK